MRILHSLTSHAIVSAIALGVAALAVAGVQAWQATEAGDGCTCCHKELAAYLAVYSSSSAPICSAK